MSERRQTLSEALDELGEALRQLGREVLNELRKTADRACSARSLRFRTLFVLQALLIAVEIFFAWYWPRLAGFNVLPTAGHGQAWAWAMYWAAVLGPVIMLGAMIAGIELVVRRRRRRESQETSR